MKLSIIVPTLNEAEHCKPLFEQLKELKQALDAEVIVVDGGSKDGSRAIIEAFGFSLLDSVPGRAVQLQKACEKARGEYFLIIHADSRFDEQIISTINKLIDRETSLASFRLKFDWDHWFLRLNAFFSGFKHPAFYFGDQALWISRQLYQECGGFDNSQLIFEDQTIYRKANRIKPAIKLNSAIITSARKYRKQGVYRLQFFYYKLWLKWRWGQSQEQLLKEYQGFLSATSDTSSEKVSC